MKLKLLCVIIIGLFFFNLVSADTQTFQMKFIVPSPPPIPLNVPTTIVTGTGTVDAGNVVSTRVFNDGDHYNISEVVGTPGFQIFMNFSNFTSIQQLKLVHSYDGNLAHIIDIEAWNGTAWVNIGNFSDMGGFENDTFFLDSSTYNVSGNISVRLTHSSPGNINHDYSLDYAVLESADTTPPTFDNLRNFTHTVNTSFTANLDASDDVAIDCFSLNDTGVFDIDCFGTITNVTALTNITIYWLNVTVNDTSSNEASGEFFINVVAAAVSRTCRYKKLGYYDTRLPWLWEVNCL